MDIEDAVRTRRSVREYLNKDVSKEDVEAVLEAGRWAPSGLNNQPWRFRILSRHEKERVAKYTEYSRTILTAPVCVAVFLEKEACYNTTKDLQAVGACIQNMLLAAHGRRLGAVWLGEILNKHAEVEKELGIGSELMAIISLGHPAEKGGDPTRVKLERLMV